MPLTQIFLPIMDELGHVESLIRRTMVTNTPKNILQILDYLMQHPGKRLRPALALLTFKALTYGKDVDSRQVEDVIKLGAAVELIHMASLVHDDVIDKAPRRHNQPSIHAKWGEEVSVPLGVYLYSDSLRLISSVGNNDALRCISHTVKSMCKGELFQVLERDNPELMLKKYLVILKKKTAVLFSAACQCGALLAHQDHQMMRRFKTYGTDLGMVFQIIDDYLDVTGDSTTLCKGAGQDFDLGEVTLPILFLLDSVSSEERARLIQLINQKDLAAFVKVQEQLRNSEPAMDGTKRLAFHYLDRAKATVAEIDPSPFQKSLVALTEFIRQRGFV